jgi:DNA-binding SARP family transcriptional activator
MDFRILGQLEVLDEGRSVALGGSKQQALLALLLIHANETLTTDRLIDELWGERPPVGAAKTLQMHISRLRKALGAGTGPGSASVVVTRGRGYELELDPDRLDSHCFEQLVAEGRSELARGRPEPAVSVFERALSLWRGEPLPELAHEPFAQREIARLDDLRVGALEELIEAKLALGANAEVVGQLAALIAEQPYRERPRAQLMLALYRSERQADALQAYQDARRTLVEELGIEPSERLRALERAILAQDPGLHLAAAEPPVAAEPAVETQRGVFAGRDPELAKLIAGLDDAFDGRGRLFLLAGEPGIGKSRLAEELVVRARGRTAQVLTGRCWEAGGAPAYWPWVQALRSYLREGNRDTLRSQLGRGGPELVAILPELRELIPDLPAVQAPESEGARFRLFESVASFLRSAAASQPLTVFLDDLHAADAPSLLLLRFVAGELAGAPIMIVGCYRDTEVGADLAEALAELSREATVHRLVLKGLGRADTSRLLELTMGQAPADQLAERVHAETQGNPLFAAEIGRLIASEGSSEQSQDRLPLPEGVREAIGLRLQRQSEECREVLTLASVIGREFGVDALGRASGLEEAALFELLEEAAVARLIGDVPGAGARLRFTHILVRDTLYEDVPAPRRLRLHRAIGETLEALYGRDLDPHLAELAHHYLQAGSIAAEKAIEYAERAGDRAASQHGYEEAGRHYSSALRVIETTGSADANRKCELLLSLGEVLSRAGSGQEAKQVLLRAAALAEQAGRPDQLARAALAYGGRFAWARASTDPALVPLLERALAAAGQQDIPARVRLLARLAGAMRDEPSRDRRVRLAEEALDLASQSGDPATFAFALEGHWIAVEGPREILAGEGIAVCEKLISLGEQLGDKELVFAGHDHRFHSVWMLCDRAAVEVEMEALSALADELRQPAQRWHVGTGRTMLALMEGRFEQAEELISETLALGQRAQSWNAVVTQRLTLFVLRRAQGRLAELEDSIRRSVHEYPALLRFRCALAHLYGELGRERDARATFDSLLSRDLAREHLDAEWLFSMTLLADPCAFLGDQPAAAKLYSLLLPYEHLYAQAPVEAVFGALARGLGVLATTLRRFENGERHFDVAIESERRMGARPWLAHAQHDLAGMLLARGGARDRERARALLDEALSAYRDLGMETWATRAESLHHVVTDMSDGG